MVPEKMIVCLIYSSEKKSLVLQLARGVINFLVVAFVAKQAMPFSLHTKKMFSPFLL